MISCDDCQRRLVAVLDKEGAGDDEKLISVHLKDCPQCRAFQEDIVKLRQRFVSVVVPDLPALVRQEVMQVAHADSFRRENQQRDKGAERQPIMLRFPRLTWAGGLAAVFLIAASWLVSFNLARKVEALKQELETSRQELALAREKEQFKEAQERQQKAISELRIRVKELEGQVQRAISPRMAWQSDSPYYRPERPGGL